MRARLLIAYDTLLDASQLPIWAGLNRMLCWCQYIVHQIQSSKTVSVTPCDMLIIIIHVILPNPEKQTRFRLDTSGQGGHSATNLPSLCVEVRGQMSN